MGQRKECVGGMVHSRKRIYFATVPPRGGGRQRRCSRTTLHEGRRPCLRHAPPDAGTPHVPHGLPRPPAAPACRFVQVVLALFHVHGKQVLHRDVKSQNIFIAEGAYGVTQRGKAIKGLGWSACGER